MDVTLPGIAGLSFIPTSSPFDSSHPSVWDVQPQRGWDPFEHRGHRGIYPEHRALHLGELLTPIIYPSRLAPLPKRTPTLRKMLNAEQEGKESEAPRKADTGHQAGPDRGLASSARLTVSVILEKATIPPLPSS